MGGIGALGRSARYCCSKMGTNSELTKDEASTELRGAREARPSETSGNNVYA